MSRSEDLDVRLSDINTNSNFRVVRRLIEPILATNDLSNQLEQFRSIYQNLDVALKAVIQYLNEEKNTENIGVLYRSLFLSFKMVSNNLYKTLSDGKINNHEIDRKSKTGLDKVILSYWNTKYYPLVEDKFDENKKLFLLLSTQPELYTAHLFSIEINEIFSTLLDDVTYLPIPIFACTEFIFSSLMRNFVFSGFHYSGHSDTSSFFFYARLVSSVRFANYINNSVLFRGSLYDLIYLNSCFSNATLKLINGSSYKNSLSYLTSNYDKPAYDFSTDFYYEYTKVKSFSTSFHNTSTGFTNKGYLTDLIFV